MAEIKTRHKPENSYLAKNDPRMKPQWPSDREMPPVLMFKRKAIRVYPDNRKVALYYSQAIDDYLSIPFGEGKRKGVPMVNEENTATNKKSHLGTLLRDYIKKAQKQKDEDDADNSVYDHRHYEKDMMYVARHKHSKNSVRMARIQEKLTKAKEYEDNMETRLRDHIAAHGHDADVDETIHHLSKVGAKVRKMSDYADRREAVKSQDPAYQIGWHGADLAVKGLKAVGRGIKGVARRAGMPSWDAIHRGIQDAHAKYQSQMAQQVSAQRQAAPQPQQTAQAQQPRDTRPLMSDTRFRTGGPEQKAQWRADLKKRPRASDVLKEMAPILPLIAGAARVAAGAAGGIAARAGARSVGAKYLQGKAAEGLASAAGSAAKGIARSTKLNSQLARQGRGGGVAGTANKKSGSLFDRLSKSIGPGRSDSGGGGFNVSKEIVTRQQAPSFASDIFVRNPVQVSSSMSGASQRRPVRPQGF